MEITRAWPGCVHQTTLLDRQHRVVSAVPCRRPGANRRLLDCDAHVPVQQAGEEQQKVFVLGEWSVYEPHSRYARQIGPQGKQFPGELPRRRLEVFEAAEM